MNNKLSDEDIKLFRWLVDDEKCKYPHIASQSEVMLKERVLLELLAYREAESKPVAWSLTYTQKDNPNNKHTSQHDSESIANAWKQLHELAGFEVTIQPLYASPVLSQPVPDELPEPQDSCAGYYRDGWNDCRAAVLSASPVLGQTPALTDVIAERQRQITTEGWTPEHDDRHSDNELAGAAACYAMNMHDFYIHYTDEFNWSEAPKPDDWPWSEEWWKPTNPRRDLVKAAALILAEIERLDRAAIAKATGESE